jgi:four helix bundle protein
MVYLPKNPTGYRSLVTWKQAGEIYRLSKDFTRSYLHPISDSRLTAHINDSARSVQRNIEEGYKRCSTKEYVQFLGFSRASLEELKGDFEELKREWLENIRWAEKGITGGDKGMIGGDKGRIWGDKGMIGGDRGGAGSGVMVKGKIDKLLSLIYGEDCMMGRQIASLERKMVDEKTLPRNEVVRNYWKVSGAAEKRFWNTVDDKYGIIRGDKGHYKGIEGKDEGIEEK